VRRDAGFARADNVAPGGVRVAGLVLAAGLGTRAGSSCPKAFFRLRGVPLYAIAARLLRPSVDRLVVGVPTALVTEAREELEGLAEVYPGGHTRFDTIAALAAACTEDLIVVHEAARPFATPALLSRVLNAARVQGAAVPATVPTSRVARVVDGCLIEIAAKTEAHVLQMPQAYRRGLLQYAIRTAKEEGLIDPTPAEVLLRLAVPVRVLPGEEHNFKITTPWDWEVAQGLVASISLEHRAAAPDGRAP